MTSKPLNVTCLCSYPYGVSPNPRFRWEQWDPLLQEHGVHTTFVNFSTMEMDRTRRAGDQKKLLVQCAARYPQWIKECLEHTRDADLVVVSIKAALAGPPVAEYLLHALDRPFIFDVDDAHHVQPDGDYSVIQELIRSNWRIPYVARWASHITVGNNDLMRHYATLNDSVHYWPTTVSHQRYAPPERDDDHADRPLVVGWTGSPSTALYLESILPLLKQLQRDHDFELFVFGADIDLQGVRGRCETWTVAREVDAVHEMDIGVMPLYDSEWAKFKCGLKAIQYLGAAVPAVVSDVGVNKHIVHHGEHGFVVDTPDDWLEALSNLLQSQTLRRDMGQAGREHVIEHYSAEAWAPRFAAQLRDFAQTHS